MKNLTAYNECNEREISMMVGKAMCAYANHASADLNNPNLKPFGKEQVKLAAHGAWSEYEATVRCIDMFVREDIYEIQRYIMGRVEDEFGIK